MFFLVLVSMSLCLPSCIVFKPEGGTLVSCPFLQVRASLGLFFLLCAAHVAMVVERNPMERKLVGVFAVERSRRLVGGRRRASSKLILNDRNPRLTPPDLSDPVGEDVRGPDSKHKLPGCRGGGTASAGNHLHPRYKHMADMRPFEGMISEQESDRLKDQTGLSVLSWNAGLRRGKVTTSLVGSFHVILLQEAVSHLDEATKIDPEQFHVYHGADQLILSYKNTFDLGIVKTDKVILGTSNQDTFGLKYVMVRSLFSRPPKHGTCTYTPASVHLSNTTGKRRGVARSLVGQFRDTAERNDVDIIIGTDFNMSANCERGKPKPSSFEEAWWTTLLIPPPDLVPMWGQIEDFGDWFRLHRHDEERYKLACRHA